MYKSRSTYQSETGGSFTSGTDKWTGQEVEDAFLNLSDSVAWESRKVTMTSNLYDCSLGNLQERTLTGNGALTISSAEAGKYYTLIKKGAFTMSLPTGHFSGGGSTVPSGTVVVTFLYDGTNYFFSFTTYAST